jgi:8-amino-7-oxononanoate synthase
MTEQNRRSPASSAGAGRRLQMLESNSGPEIVLDGRTYVNFGGSCYLGMSSHADVIESGVSALRRYGAQSQIGRHYDVALPPNADAEHEGALYFGTEASIYFASGYLIGLIALHGLRDRYDTVLIDEAVHLNLRDAVAAGGKPSVTFKHMDASSLAEEMDRAVRAGVRPLVVTDGMSPTFGAIAPLREYLELIEPLDGVMLVDESHSFGVIGPRGRGAVDLHGIASDRVLVGGSLGKAFGAYGAMIPASRAIVDQLWRSRPALGAGAGLSAGAAMAATSLRHVREHPELLARLRRNVARVKRGMRALGLDVADTDAPLATFTSGTAAEMRALQLRLMAEGIFVFYSTYVGAGPNGAIRCAVFADHTEAQIDRLHGALRALL